MKNKFYIFKDKMSKLSINNNLCETLNICNSNYSNSNNNLFNQSYQNLNIINSKSNLYEKFFDEKSSEKSEKIFSYKIICKICRKFPSISINDYYKIDSDCDCCIIKNMDTIYFLDNFIERDIEINYPESKIILQNYCTCISHEEKYIYYCIDCSENLCEKCIKETNNHFYDLIIYLNNEDIKEKISAILKFINKNNDFEDEFPNIFKIIKLVLISHKVHPHYNIYRTINNIYEFIQREMKNINNNSNKSKKEMIKLIKIKYQKDLNNIYPNDLIYSINFNRRNFNDLNKLIPIFANREMNSLKYLYLSDCNISNIDPLLYLNIPNLEHLDLSMNYITDNYIYIFENEKFYKLKLLNLFGNHFHSSKLFQCFKEYKQMEELMLGSNDIEKSIKEIKNDIKFEITTHEIGLTRGIFSNESINYISHFIFHNLEILYLSGNNICSLDFIEFLDNVDLKEFWFSSNLITEFFPLIKFINLRKILLNNNPISNISKLKEFTDNLKNLKMIDFRDTNIDINSEENERIIKGIELIQLRFE